MNINLYKLLLNYRSALLAILAASLSSCKLPQAETYAKSEWAVHTIPTQEEQPLSFKVQDIQELPMNEDQELSFAGTAPVINHVPSTSVNASDPLSTVQDPGKPISDSLLNVETIPQNTAAIAVTTKGTTTTPDSSLLPTINADAPPSALTHAPAPSPATAHAAKLVESSRPPMPPRGSTLQPVPNSATASIQESPPSEELAEILQLAKKIEATAKP